MIKSKQKLSIVARFAKTVNIEKLYIDITSKLIFSIKDSSKRKTVTKINIPLGVSPTLILKSKCFHLVGQD